MPISFDSDHENRRVLVIATGSISLADLSSYMDARVKAGVYDYDQLVDFRDADFGSTAPELLALVMSYRGHLDGAAIPLTAVAARAELNPGERAEYERRFGDTGSTVRVFDTVVQAERWLAEQRAARR